MWNSSFLKCLINSANALHWKTWIQLSLNQRFAHLRVRGALVRNSVYLRIAMRPLIELVKLGSHGAVTRTRKGQSARNSRRCFLRFRLPWTTRKRTDRSRDRIDEHPTAVHRYPYLESDLSCLHAPPSTSNRNNDPRLPLYAQSYLPYSKKLASDIGMKGGNVLGGRCYTFTLIVTLLNTWFSLGEK